jgi:hypothetical protein
MNSERKKDNSISIFTNALLKFFIHNRIPIAHGENLEVAFHMHRDSFSTS